MQLLPQHPSLTLRVTINATALKFKVDGALVLKQAKAARADGTFSGVAMLA
jgi:hypothetical protein